MTPPLPFPHPPSEHGRTARCLALFPLPFPLSPLPHHPHPISLVNLNNRKISPQSPFHLPPSPLPLRPPTPHIPNPDPLPLPRHPRRGPTPNPGVAVEDHFVYSGAWVCLFPMFFLPTSIFLLRLTVFFMRLGLGLESGFLSGAGSLKPKPLPKLALIQVKRVGIRGQRHGVRAWDAACSVEFGGFADVDYDGCAASAAAALGGIGVAVVGVAGVGIGVGAIIDDRAHFLVRVGFYDR